MSASVNRLNRRHPEHRNHDGWGIRASSDRLLQFQDGIVDLGRPLIDRGNHRARFGIRHGRRLSSIGRQDRHRGGLHRLGHDDLLSLCIEARCRPGAVVHKRLVENAGLLQRPRPVAGAYVVWSELTYRGASTLTPILLALGVGLMAPEAAHLLRHRTP